MSRDSVIPGTLAEVECLAHEGGWTLVFVQELSHPPDKVWAALTEPEQLSGWSPFTASRNLDGTGDATLTMIDGETRVDMVATVRHAERPRLLEYTWDGDVLRWELSATSSGTRLTLRHTVGSLDWVPKVAAGWHICLAVAGRLLDGDPIGPIVGEAAKAHGWDELHDAYTAELGIETAG